MSEDDEKRNPYLALGWAIAVVVLLPAIVSPYLYEIPFRILIGWAVHAMKLLSEIAPHGSTPLLSIGCLLVAILLGHRLTNWFRRARGIESHWKPVHTVIATTLLLLGAAAAISLSGVAHQLAWLRSAPMIVDRSRASEASRASFNARQLWFPLVEYAEEHNRYPETLKDLVREQKLPASILQATRSRSGPTDSFVLLLPGQEPGESSNRPLVIAAISDEKGNQLLVLRESGETQILPVEKTDQILREARAHE
ncbi:hypothetical protein [Luteolibacter sp. LG18]|uniref:hypothetical protein n=1 Tax=Luteolibacter sp. LG18 TaxID=2819286 RepID=UPI002B29A257|nr:hypothetical protein llg_31930 [Luteolibacter sp. LG18]